MTQSSGREHELEQFLAGIEHKAFQIANAALWDREAALDAVQESMTRLVQYYREKPAGEWPALFRTVLNSQVNEIRRKRLLQKTRLKLVSLTGLGGHGGQDNNEDMDLELPGDIREDGISDPEASVVSREIKQRITAAVENLSWRQRQVFLLREMQGWNIHETAEALGCSETSVKQHHFRAMGALRKQLGELWEHEHE